MYKQKIGDKVLMINEAIWDENFRNPWPYFSPEK